MNVPVIAQPWKTASWFLIKVLWMGRRYLQPTTVGPDGMILVNFQLFFFFFFNPSSKSKINQKNSCEEEKSCLRSGLGCSVLTLEALHIKQEVADVYLRNTDSAKPAVFQQNSHLPACTADECEISRSASELRLCALRCECWRRRGNVWQRTVDALEWKHAA